MNWVGVRQMVHFRTVGRSITLHYLSIHARFQTFVDVRITRRLMDTAAGVGEELGLPSYSMLDQK